MISNSPLWKRIHQRPIEEEIINKLCMWTGYILMKSSNRTTKQAPTLNREGKQKGGRPENSLRWELEVHTKTKNSNWK
ncbi:unnamed protein product [Schistosoma curassoni]|uniref:Ovule protein n=1 Tax=Schistosoma curassoni TaxID=6186 RepID=A0A183JNW0_9TREM|nr:unnamed protein product [Schistosoma curassoni]